MDARDWDRRWREQEELHPRGEATSPVTDMLDSLEAGRALDLACGAGRHAVWLAERGWRVTGVDFSGAALAQALARAAGHGVDVEWVHADVLLYQPQPAAHDLVLVAYLHVPAAQRRLVLRKAAGALAPGGRLLVVGHDTANLGTGAPGPSDPALLYAPDEIAAELPGLDIERAEQVVRAVETEAGEAAAVDALVLAVRR